MFGIFNKGITDKNIVNQSTYMSVTNVADYFKISPRELNKIFSNLKWIEKNDAWWIPTKLGKIKGAIQKYNYKNKKKYIIWNSNIKKSLTLVHAVQELKNHKKLEVKPKKMTNKQKKEKGDIYEDFIFKKYKLDNYIVAPHGKVNGKKDAGIDIIAIKDKKILFIQCKHWDEKTNYKITDTHIKKTRMEAIDYIEENPMFDSANYQKMTLYVTSAEILHWSAKHYLDKYEDIEHLVIPM